MLLLKKTRSFCLNTPALWDVYHGVCPSICPELFIAVFFSASTIKAAYYFEKKALYRSAVPLDSILKLSEVILQFYMNSKKGDGL